VESTIVDCTGERLRVLRLGGVDGALLASIAGYTPERADRGEVAAPGTLVHHYAPRARVVLVDPDEVAPRGGPTLGARERAGLLGLRVDMPAQLHSGIEVLAAPADVEAYARMLYECLREADRRGLRVVYAIVPPEHGIGAAIADRLRRAAAPATTAQ
jgi:L-threonylcarbamoyladenylate synthase